VSPHSKRSALILILLLRKPDKSGQGQGNGKRVGTAYQLDSGGIIYVPE